MPKASESTAVSGARFGWSTGWLSAAALVLIVLSGAWLRLTGIGFLLPSEMPPDGQVLQAEVRFLNSDDPAFDREHGAGLYPQLLPRIAAALIDGESTVARGDALADHLAAAAAPRLELRIVLALLSLLIVPATWLIARQFLAPGWSIVAAALMNWSVLELWFSQQERPHAAAAGFATAAVACALYVRRHPGITSAVLAGVAIGLAAGALQSGLAVLPAFLVAFLLSRPSARALPHVWAVACAGIAAVMCRIFYPFVFDAHQVLAGRTIDVVGSQVNLSGHKIDLGLFNGSGFAHVFEAFGSYEPVISALALVGILVWSVRRMRAGSDATPAPPIDRERRADLLVVLAYVLPYSLAIGLYANTFQRFVIPLLPYAACLAAYGMSSIVSALSTWNAPVLARRGLVCALVAVPLGTEGWTAYKLASARGEPSTIALAARWIAENVRPKDQRVLVEPALDLPLFQTREALAANERMLRKRAFDWTCYQWRVPEDRRPKEQYDLRTIATGPDELANAFGPGADDFVRSLSGDYAVIKVYETWGRKSLRDLRRQLQHSAVRVARFSPDREDRWSELPFTYQDEYLRKHIFWFSRILGACRSGPVVEIYKLEP